MKSSIFSKVSLGFGAALAIVLAIDVVSYRSLRALIAHVEAMFQIERIDHELIHVLRLLQDAETGQRGFVITGEKSYLQPYEEALRTLHQDIGRMREMVLRVGSRPLQDSVNALDPLVDEKLAELRDTIEARRQEGFDAAQVLVRSNHGMNAMNNIRRLIGEMRRETREMIRDAEAEMEARVWDTIAVLSAGSVLGFILLAGAAYVIHQDLEQRQRLEKSLRQSETMQAMGALVAGVAHRVRNPLFAITATVDALEKRLGTGEEYGRHLEVLKIESGRLAKLMQQLLNYGRPLMESPYPVCVAEVLREVTKSFERMAQQAQVRLKLDAPGELPPLLLDRERLVELFHNLIENAIQFSPREGVVRITARAAVQKGKPWIECIIEDEGPGIEDVDLPHVFEPFYSRRNGGTGLGLAVAQQIVLAAGGELDLRNRVGEGAVARIRLPAQADGAKQARGQISG
jgi:signal transduction histidine kinase